MLALKTMTIVFHNPPLRISSCAAFSRLVSGAEQPALPISKIATSEAVITLIFVFIFVPSDSCTSRNFSSLSFLRFRIRSIGLESCIAHPANRTPCKQERLPVKLCTYSWPPPLAGMIQRTAQDFLMDGGVQPASEQFTMTQASVRRIRSFKRMEENAHGR